VSFLFRTALLRERAALEALQRRASLVWEEYRASLLEHPDAIEIPDAQLADGRCRVAETDGKVIGFTVVLPASPGAVELDGLFVEPDFWGGGVGRLLIADATRIARDEGAIAMEVTANPRALEFYKKVGFVIIGQASTRFGAGVRMRLTIDSARCGVQS
jgi:GNAT superfamily N-acetyltransferase